MLKLLLVVILFAAIIYVTVRVIQRRGISSPLDRRTFGRPSGRPATRRGPLGPDDDDDFLRDLERKRRRKPETPES